MWWWWIRHQLHCWSSPVRWNWVICAITQILTLCGETELVYIWVHVAVHICYDGVDKASSRLSVFPSVVKLGHLYGKIVLTLLVKQCIIYGDRRTVCMLIYPSTVKWVLREVNRLALCSKRVLHICIYICVYTHMYVYVCMWARNPGVGVRVRALVVGDSFVRSFASHVTTTGRSQNLSLEEVDVSYESISGGTVTSIEQAIPVWLDEYQPHIVIFLVAGNDLTHQAKQSWSVRDQLLQLTKWARDNKGVLQLAICSVLDRDTYPSTTPAYPNKVVQFNR